MVQGQALRQIQFVALHIIASRRYRQDHITASKGQQVYLSPGISLVLHGDGALGSARVLGVLQNGENRCPKQGPRPVLINFIILYIRKVTWSPKAWVHITEKKEEREETGREGFVRNGGRERRQRKRGDGNAEMRRCTMCELAERGGYKVRLKAASQRQTVGPVFDRVGLGHS